MILTVLTFLFCNLIGMSFIVTGSNTLNVVGDVYSHKYFSGLSTVNRVVVHRY